MLTSSRLRLAVPVGMLSLLAAITWYPLLFMFSTSFKTREQFFADYWWFSWPLDVDNYVQVWPKVSVAILNSLQYSGGTLVLVLLLFLGQKLMRGWFQIVVKRRSQELFMLNLLLITYAK